MLISTIRGPVIGHGPSGIAWPFLAQGEVDMEGYGIEDAASVKVRDGGVMGGDNSFWVFDDTLLKISASQDVALAGNKLLLDADEDTYIQSVADDRISFVANNLPYIIINGITASTICQKAVNLYDNIKLLFGNASDAVQQWDTAETTHKWKFGLPSAGEGASFGPIADLGVDRYGATALPFGWWTRADDTTQANRVGMYHDGTDGFIDSAAGDMRIAVAGVAKINANINESAFTEKIRMWNGKDFETGTSTGSKIMSAANQKGGFWGATPIVQPVHIADPAGGATIDAEARAAIVLINAMLAATGLTAAA